MDTTITVVPPSGADTGPMSVSSTPAALSRAANL
jgi:hypothetical protein